MRSVTEHRARLLAGTAPLPAVSMATGDCLGLVLAEDARAATDLPGFDNSGMDGYAVRAAEVTTASQDRPVVLPVDGDIAAGDTRRHVLVPGHTMRIMIGAPLPAGADAVVPVELSDGGTHVVRLRLAAEVGRHVRRRAEDVRSGDVILGAGALVGPGQVALLSAANLARVRARPRPRVAVWSTGDELVPVGSDLVPGRIVDSNGPMLAALVQAAGGEVVVVGTIADRRAAVQTLASVAEGERADLIVTTGGVSMGAYDTVKQVLADEGVEFVRVAMRPGMPQGFGHIGPRGTPILTLPGNPVSALVSFHVFVLPVIRALAGLPVGPVPADGGYDAVAAVGWTSVRGKAEWTRVVAGPDGLRPSGGQGSHMLGALAGATALALVPEEVVQVRAGDWLRCLPILGQDRPMTEPRLTHVRGDGSAHMVDVSGKAVTVRSASAAGRVLVSAEVVAALRGAGVPKGDALAVARIAGIQAVKRTPDLIPLAHPIAVHAVDVDLTVADDAVLIGATVRTADRTGIEMEALTAVSVAALALVDMVKAVDRHTRITDVRVTAKSGGRSGDWSEA